MKRSITGFGQDEAGDYYVTLDCGHRQHVRHNPPLNNRAWVLTANGRSAKIGHSLDCPLCDRAEMPEGLTPFQQTPVFTEASIPAGLQQDHATGSGIWAKIRVQAGQLRYQAPDLGIDTVLSPPEVGVIVPTVRHAVTPIGTVHFFVEFFRRVNDTANEDQEGT